MSHISETLKIRKINSRDLTFLYNLKNDVEVRKSSFNSNMVRLETHKEWFENRLNNKRSMIYIGEVEGRSVGQIRFDIEQPGVVEIDISVTPDSRKKGYGSILLREGCRYLFEITDIKIVIARIKLDNLTSQKMFYRCGFINKGVVDYKGHKCLEMKLTTN